MPLLSSVRLQAEFNLFVMFIVPKAEFYMHSVGDPHLFIWLSFMATFQVKITSLISMERIA